MSLSSPPRFTSSLSSRHRIVSGARRHFFAHGFRGVTMDDLAGELGMSKKTLYAHFRSKASLIEAVLHNKFQSVEADLRQITSLPDFPRTLQRLLACIHEHTTEIQRPFLRDIRRETPDLFRIVERRRRDIIQRHFAKVLSVGRRAGLVRKDVSATLAVEILLAGVQGVMNPDKMAELDLTPTTGFAAIIGIFLKGVLTETGRSKL
jgi:AcrR family transcriptional regulator